MFTPPPSPLPAHDTPLPTPTSHQRYMSQAFNLSLPPAAKFPARERREHVLAIHDRKRRTGWRTYTIAVMFPLLLVLVTLSSRYFTLSRFVHLVAGIFRESRLSAASAAGARSIVHPLHRRQSGLSADLSGIPAPTSSVSGILFPSQSAASSSIPPTPTQSVSSTVPTIPSSPVLPTPFPQPFDTTLANNFTTTSCEDFFTNMTQSLPFRQCRPFSFLSQTSSVFLQVSGSFRLSDSCFDVDTRSCPRGRHNPILRLSTPMYGVLAIPPWPQISARPTWVGLHQTFSLLVPAKKANKIKWCYKRLLVFFSCNAILAL